MCNLPLNTHTHTHTHTHTLAEPRRPTSSCHEHRAFAKLRRTSIPAAKTSTAYIRAALKARGFHAMGECSKTLDSQQAAWEVGLRGLEM
ncbi:hypothetical protein K505DRAFT_10603 [Melanomma pulvis-pyrius CBS 109.77]|uniref:Uncharacterized protein n=1 Tax=Melanomma pulvis-pyrius CBS 109.77 TaxID=1314802 RepID=A0A6A6XGJ2_9PLEO|nr:hypothetical protein K505DRAFT_10603 [Melanomma pulvis-pyrius CBS 109.77]